MLTWIIEYQGYTAPIERVTIPAIREEIDPIRSEIAGALSELDADTDELTVAFVLDDDRHLSVELRGDTRLVQQAQDALGTKREIGRLLN